MTIGYMLLVTEYTARDMVMITEDDDEQMMRNKINGISGIPRYQKQKF